MNDNDWEEVTEDMETTEFPAWGAVKVIVDEYMPRGTIALSDGHSIVGVVNLQQEEDEPQE